VSNRTITPDTDRKFCESLLNALAALPKELPSISVDEDKTRNAARCMTEFLCGRLTESGGPPEVLERTTVRWRNALINLRNAVRDHLWTNLRPHFVEKFRELATDAPAAYLMTSWQPEGEVFHVWAIPEQVVYEALPKHGVEQTDKRSIEIFPEVNRFERCDDSPDLSPFYRQLKWSKAELEKLVEAAKIDEGARRRNRDQEPSPGDEEESSENPTAPGYTSATVEFLKELPAHVNDGDWHEANKTRFHNVLRDPSGRLVEMLRAQYIERLSPEVAGGKRHLSILKKNDYGKGGYHAHYWFAFYDPKAGSKTKSVQLYFALHGSTQVWRYGFSMGDYCDEYLARLLGAWQHSAATVASYIRNAPDGTVVGLPRGEDEQRMSPDRLAQLIMSPSQEELVGFTKVHLFRVFSLDTLPEHDDTLVQEIGEFFTWAWPLFEASVTGVWPQSKPAVPHTASVSEESEDVDEDAPGTLDQLSALTCLSLSFLEELEQALLARQQAVLVGPPGTSKTYIARQFARYFVAQHPGRPQGSHHILYMHANWTYEDFFEGIKPSTTKAGILTFQPQKGFFLEWTEQLKAYDSACRHVLVLDEINRCDTAAVLGELLQLLEYRGTTIRLLSGRSFVFPSNLFVIGTMNSADRSIGRMDLALRRRFLWLNLYPQPESLQQWLDRLGNNPVGFKASSLAECNDLLAKRGIPAEQHIGHALFMIQETSSDDGFLAHDIPLTEKHLRRVVQFSVIPYVRELFTTQFGIADEEIVNQMRDILLKRLSTVPEGKETRTA
jgi:hypothetical protein